MISSAHESTNAAISRRDFLKLGAAAGLSLCGLSNAKGNDGFSF